MIEFTAQSPPEPAVGSVVLDPDGIVWQRLDPGEGSFESIWCPARVAHPFLTNEGYTRPWPMLLVEKRRLVLIYDASRATLARQVSVETRSLADQLDAIPPR